MGWSPRCSRSRSVDMTSINDIVSVLEDSSNNFVAAPIAVGKLFPLHGQQAAVFSSARSHLGFSHWSSHLGRGQVEGLAHAQLHCVSSQSGAQLASGAMQVVRHSAGAHTVSHLGQSSFSHISLGHLTEHSGCSQWTVHCAHAASWHCISHFGRAHTGWHTAGHMGSSHCHLHSGWHLSEAITAAAEAITNINKLNSF